MSLRIFASRSSVPLSCSSAQRGSKPSKQTENTMASKISLYEGSKRQLIKTALSQIAASRRTMCAVRQASCIWRLRRWRALDRPDSLSRSRSTVSTSSPRTATPAATRPPITRAFTVASQTGSRYRPLQLPEDSGIRVIGSAPRFPCLPSR